jgi:hypothetical protein
MIISCTNPNSRQHNTNFTDYRNSKFITFLLILIDPWRRLGYKYKMWPGLIVAVKFFTSLKISHSLQLVGSLGQISEGIAALELGILDDT